ncbi:MAG: methyltransferase domain-containing protein [Candidatus Nanoarchaeia archaeon]|jgi:ubiquinone/menaquinone biosynthesis C-methylase UbiE
MNKKELLKETIQTYEGYANAYDNKWGNYTGLELIADNFISYLKGKKVIDIGCGPGRDSKYLSNKGFELTGIDLTNNFLKIAKNKVPAANFYRMDMRQLSFRNESFDGIWCNGAFLHIPKDENRLTMQEFYRILNSQGVMYLSVKIGNGEKIVEKDYWKGRKLFVYYSENEIMDLLKNTGFEIIKTLIRHQNEDWINIFARK